MSGLFGIYAVLYIFQFFSKSVLNVVRQSIRVTAFQPHIHIIFNPDNFERHRYIILGIKCFKKHLGLYRSLEKKCDELTKMKALDMFLVSSVVLSGRFSSGFRS